MVMLGARARLGRTSTACVMRSSLQAQPIAHVSIVTTMQPTLAMRASFQGMHSRINMM